MHQTKPSKPTENICAAVLFKLTREDVNRVIHLHLTVYLNLWGKNIIEQQLLLSAGPLNYCKCSGNSVMEMYTYLYIWCDVCVFIPVEDVTYVYRTPVSISLRTASRCCSVAFHCLNLFNLNVSSLERGIQNFDVIT